MACDVQYLSGVFRSGVGLDKWGKPYRVLVPFSFDGHVCVMQGLVGPLPMRAALEIIDKARSMFPALRWERYDEFGVLKRTINLKGTARIR